ncbi:MarR family winged helix-turn-helix transcriptional regulator [Nocardia sp. NPDC101769]|uniref:MarR family winged helix-turn-helix transcriptional regulator n=1 Tax=Nocardia sp. NPDC101769 TaxID=3364333 RepID=UPI0038135773
MDADKYTPLSQGSAAFREYLTAQAVVAHVTAQALGLGPTDFFGLNLIALAGSMTAGELADRTGLSTGAVTRLVDRLERAGYVRRVPDPADRRKVVIEPAPDPDGRIDAVLAPQRTRMAEMFADYGPQQLEVLFDYFARAATALRETAHQLQRP